MAGIISPERQRRIALTTPHGLLAFGFGSGLSPLAPGTAGTVFALLPACLLMRLPWSLAAGVVGLSFLLGVWVCARVSRDLGVHDHGGIVFDEFVGLWLVLLFLPMDWRWWAAAVVVFRLFDIVKPWPIRWLDRHVSGGFGIMLDDALAAVYSIVVLWLAGGVRG